MPDLSFPVVPAVPPPTPAPIELLVRRAPLSAIREVLSISIDDIVNDRRLKYAVHDLYRVTRRIEDEAWLKHRIEDRAAEAWIAAHL